VDAPDVGLTGRLAQQEASGSWPLREKADVRVDAGAKALGRLRGGERRLDALDEGVAVGLEDRPVQRRLRAEVVVQGRFRHVGERTDLDDRRRVEPLAGEQLPTGLQDSLAPWLVRPDVGTPRHESRF
jgi:hypothetical protein